MAEKTEQPTSKKRKDSAKKGRRSKVKTSLPPLFCWWGFIFWRML